MTRKLDGQTLLFATHNSGKLEEMAQLLSPMGVQVVSAADMSLPEPEETEDTFVGNARIKAHAAARLTGMVAMSDDSGLCVDSLDGAPGVYTADWAEAPGGRDFLKAMTRTHRELSERGAAEPWRASFRCVLVLAWPDGHDEVFEGAAHGRLIWPIRGALGHGYDPMFVPDFETQSFAEMDAHRKNALSHRAKALKSLVDACFT